MLSAVVVTVQNGACNRKSRVSLNDNISQAYVFICVVVV